VIDVSGTRPKIVESGTVSLPSSLPLPARLAALYERVAAVIARTSPDCCAIETAFYHKNAQSTLKIGHARGVLMLAAHQAELPIGEYAPREVKKSVTGNGNATKEQVQFMTLRVLGIRHTASPLDESDALAVALCHAHRLAAPATTGAPARRRPVGRSAWAAYVKEHPQKIRR
jgi:crossover junction endodeoxyribonuclease RuvC